MSTIKAILIDDEQLSLDVLVWEIEGLDLDVEIIGQYTDPRIGIEAIKQDHPDLVFLDIEMPEIDGIQLVQSLHPIFFNVVFTTAYENYAVDAIKHEALDYLLKPVRPEELRRAIERHRSRNLDHLQNNLSSLFERLQKQNNSRKKVVIPTSKGLEFVELDNIMRCESSSNYTHILLRDGNKLFISKTLKEVEELLDSESFCRVHKSHLINLDAIKRYVKVDGGHIVLEDGSEIPVSRNKKGDFLGQI